MKEEGLRFEKRLEELDTGLLASIEGQTSLEDRRSLLALHLACRRSHQEFRWLEIGSYLGGSLQALVQDPACIGIDSIDSRPDEPPDERWGTVAYPENSTAHMLSLLGELPNADLSKLRAHDAGTEALDPNEIERPHLCFIDGEHTDEACLRDAEFCRGALRDVGVVAFHDVNLVCRAVSTFLGGLRRDGIAHRSVYLPDVVFAVELGPPTVLSDPAISERQSTNAEGVLSLLLLSDRHRRQLGGRRARVLRRLGLLPGGR
jgi:hypothetical protein